MVQQRIEREVIILCDSQAAIQAINGSIAENGTSSGARVSWLFAKSRHTRELRVMSEQTEQQKRQLDGD
ncbi:hypothetical protein TSTA_002930 [Talaromyces stipitatus ATCC 10500]|uniref:Uncharacterized protein n=1 Tax=Talaromyces stipitatus (strain ATCC 10500 / CBS 375.48 / QM 6759 / NRRL 1006) TaxID=441959 RepID=B8MS97_TALSN|nr:uncharacterized protein TSTA_002930 [Talaromyces stipitatus ATCC 10500]EED12230.1 hypothetical protein TSTA_002930 [Talaromyces stipitatus ATCC 10500]